MIKDALKSIKEELPSGVRLVAVSKFHPIGSILEAYSAGQRVFGESRPQEFALKVKDAPEDVEWHFIGHLQTNKLNLVLPYATLLHSVDSLHLLEAVEKWCEANSRTVNVLLEIHIGAETTKSGFHPDEVLSVLENASSFPYVRICGLMGMASNTDDENRIRSDFASIRNLFDGIKEKFPEMSDFKELSIGMSGDWRIALGYGATMVRIGTAIFGPREY